MKIFTCNYKIVFFCIFLLCLTFSNKAQSDSTKFVQRLPTDTSKKSLNMDAVYNRPFLSVGKLPVALGGYLESNTQYASTDGISDGFSFQFRRFTIFMSSTIARKIKFLSEIEFEDGAKEINIEFAAIDVELHPLLCLRGGIIMNPIGAFNQNHDGPRWDFIDRPISATTIIPSTLSNAGFGIHGKYFIHNWVFGYETYLTNGFDDRVIANSQNRTSLAAGKSSPEKFEESNSGLPMYTGKVAIRHRRVGELGISYMSGIYNRFQQDGFIIDSRRRATAMAVDFNTSLLKGRFNITGEVVKVMVQVPETYSQAFGTQQAGGFVDLIATVAQRKMLDWDKAKINVGVRLEYADYNLDRFHENNDPIGDELWAIVPTIAFRPVATTVIRFNYRFQQQKDQLRNPPASTGIIQFGFSSYF